LQDDAWVDPEGALHELHLSSPSCPSCLNSGFKRSVGLVATMHNPKREWHPPRCDASGLAVPENRVLSARFPSLPASHGPSDHHLDGPRA
jgi:hypothetical protein